MTGHCVINLQGFVLAKKFIVKELAVYYLDLAATFSFVFAPPQNAVPPTYDETYPSRKCHLISFWDGTYDYEQLEPILRMVVRDMTVWVKGSSQVHVLGQLGFDDVLDLTSIGCPQSDILPPVDVYCPQPSHSYLEYCAQRKTVKYGQFLANYLRDHPAAVSPAVPPPAAEWKLTPLSEDPQERIVSPTTPEAPSHRHRSTLSSPLRRPYQFPGDPRIKIGKSVETQTDDADPAAKWRPYTSPLSYYSLQQRSIEEGGNQQRFVYQGPTSYSSFYQGPAGSSSSHQQQQPSACSCYQGPSSSYSHQQPSAWSFYRGPSSSSYSHQQQPSTCSFYRGPSTSSYSHQQ